MREQRRATACWMSVVVALALGLVRCNASDDGRNGGDAGPDDGWVTDAATGDAPADEPFGRICKLGEPCDKDLEGYPLVCVGVEGSAAGMGFCTRNCNPQGGGPECYGVPNGQWAGCYLSGPSTDAGPGLSYCLFVCASQKPKGSWTCPGTLACGEKNEDGAAICLPR